MDHVKRVLAALDPLCEPLYDALTSAYRAAHERLPEVAADPDASATLTHAVRGMTLVNLRKKDLAGWRLDRGNNAAVHLSAGTQSLRLLHQLPGRVVPPPGTNRGRRNYYQNAMLSDGALISRDKLIGLWSADEQGAIGIEIVRPIGTWTLGQRAKCDLSFGLPLTGSELDFEKMGFMPDDTGIEIQIPGEGTNDEQRGSNS
jgi:hypothetical protein